MNESRIPDGWRLIYRNPLSSPSDAEGFRMEGDGAVSFPLGRMRLESLRDPAEGQLANLVFWCPEEFPEELAISWEFLPLREPGLAILFFCARGNGGMDLFDPALARRTGIYDQYHHGDIHAYHLSYFRRMREEERKLHTCNLRKSYGFHLAAQGADPIPGTADVKEPYRMLIVKQGTGIAVSVNELPLFRWKDDSSLGGPPHGRGRIGFRQMAPLIAEYANVKVYAP
ncbi:DUF1961 family protein [Cohnella thailandensis]|uniref:DUF1961 family protein n=1 Tax=Cohnella thailandensis TaxID=557557 RepID=A0A841SVU7_9BACL|nr:DUF1961 family protein [Cohnella thailandensis]MBB6633990.1 DUF1961 family protein [Cohnella thailandensis]MBP1972675.1 hypothetical protein [Cohnella thailandensis]